MLDIFAMLTRFVHYNLRIKLSKSHWLFSSLVTLGYLATPDGVGPSPDKIKVISEWTFPENVAQLWGHYGVRVFFSKGIPNFSQEFACIQEEIARALKIY